MNLMKFCHVHVLESRMDKPSGVLEVSPYGHVTEYVGSKNTMPEWSPRRFFSYLWPIVRNLFASREPLALTLFRNADFDRRIQELTQSGRFDVVVADGLSISLSFEGWEGARIIPAVLIQHTVESVMWRRVAGLQRNPVTFLFYHEMARRFRHREPELCRLFDGVTAISEMDAQHMRQVYGLTQPMANVPIGATLDETGIPAAVLENAESPIIAFVGGMNYQPNADAAFWFIDKVLPIVRETRPDVRLRVIGRDPPGALRRLAEKSEGIEVTGTVEEVLPLLRECMMLVVPLRAGSGVRLKIMESLSAGLPIVSTRIGAEGLSLEPGVDLLIADDAAAFAKAVLLLLEDADLRRALAEKGRERAQADFSWDRSAASLFSLLASLHEKRAKAG
ncbi:glycosyltransferase family 4 protein [Prosthecobacter sp.]|uniref:glycosyltransferase family 4 protein n=1 Tax=Prosthecobacter sp. TaxID=1965333 RepID=UPI0025D5B542|nr:glycosyltransferase family 4 protein [Prosthecobacter sp.]